MTKTRILAALVMATAAIGAVLLLPTAWLMLLSAVVFLAALWEWLKLAEVDDTLARAIITSVKSAGKPIPVVTGQDSEVESVKLVFQGVQYSTIDKDTKNFVTKVVEYIGKIAKGEAVEVNDTKSYNNGVKVIPSYLLQPQFVDKSNYKKLLIDSGYYKESDLQ